MICEFCKEAKPIRAAGMCEGCYHPPQDDISRSCEHCTGQLGRTPLGDLGCVNASSFLFDSQAVRETIPADNAQAVREFLALWGDRIDALGFFHDFERFRVAHMEAQNFLMEVCPHPSYVPGGSMGNVCSICGGRANV